MEQLFLLSLTHHLLPEVGGTETPRLINLFQDEDLVAKAQN
jgi:hypothetical protein